MIKYRVIRVDGQTEFTDSEVANKFWKDNGHIRVDTIDEPDPVPEIEDSSVTLSSLRAVLSLMKLEDAVKAIIDKIPEPNYTIAVKSWEYGNFIRRKHPLVLLIQSSLSLSDQQVNEIWAQSDRIQAA